MASVALAGPPRVNDKLQTCPTVYKCGTLVELAPQAFFCQTPDASLNHGVGLSRDISYPATHRFAKHNGSRESFSNTQCVVCFSGSVLEISFASSCASYKLKDVHCVAKLKLLFAIKIVLDSL